VSVCVVIKSHDVGHKTEKQKNWYRKAQNGETLRYPTKTRATQNCYYKARCDGKRNQSHRHGIVVDDESRHGGGGETDPNDFPCWRTRPDPQYQDHKEDEQGYRYRDGRIQIIDRKYSGNECEVGKEPGGTLSCYCSPRRT